MSCKEITHARGRNDRESSLPSSKFFLLLSLHGTIDSRKSYGFSDNTSFFLSCHKPYESKNLLRPDHWLVVGIYLLKDTCTHITDTFSSLLYVGDRVMDTSSRGWVPHQH